MKYVRWVILWLIVGAAINVGVAWTLTALFYARGPGWENRGSGMYSRPDGGDMLVLTMRRFGMAKALVDDRGRMTGFPRAGGWIEPPASSQERPLTFAVGVPFRCLRHVELSARSGGGTNGAITIGGQVFPIDVIPDAFAMNSMIFGCGAAFGVLIPRFLLRARRRSSGRCVHCGYVLAGTDRRCSECGRSRERPRARRFLRPIRVGVLYVATLPIAWCWSDRDPVRRATEQTFAIVETADGLAYEPRAAPPAGHTQSWYTVEAGVVEHGRPLVSKTQVYVGILTYTILIRSLDRLPFDSMRLAAAESMSETNTEFEAFVRSDGADAVIHRPWIALANAHLHLAPLAIVLAFVWSAGLVVRRLRTRRAIAMALCPVCGCQAYGKGVCPECGGSQ